MIDTDKYEGHTEGPWDSLVCATTGKKWIIDGPEETGQTIALVEGIGENDVGWINMWLMADAPILLEEVKRLRSLIEMVSYNLEWYPERFDQNKRLLAYKVRKWNGEEE